MKSLYSFFLVLLVSLTAQAQNSVVVKGYVTFANGVAAANRNVIISTDTINTQACQQVHVKTTNANGFYIDTLKCQNSNISRVRVITYDCNGVIAIVHDPQVPASNVVESNFSLSCNGSLTGCEAVFAYSTVPATAPATIAFNSSNSHGATATDTIVRRRWKFGDGDTLGGNTVNVTHTYTQPGTYQACLTIWTASGCENTVCKTITIAGQSTVHNVIVKGYITFNNGNAAANQAVYIAVDSNQAHNGSCFQLHTKYTNANGFYIDTLSCSSSNITNVSVWVQDCTGATPIHRHVVPASNIVESNFTICANVCHAGFTKAISNLSVQVWSTSTPSQGGTLTTHTWDFGDGSPLNSGIAGTANHTYAAPGTYRIKLIINGTNNCVDSAAEHVTVFNATGCHASIKKDTVIGTTAYFIDSSHVVAGDSIVYRSWSFGDGTSSTAPGVRVDHHYQNPGTYTVCLRIASNHGCADSVCTQITIGTPVPPCSSNYTFNISTVNYREVLFNSSASVAGAGDSIISRTWNFGDGSILNGNIVSPSHVYTQEGTYNVCLRTVTARGCIKEICKQVTIRNPHCIAKFVVNALAATSNGYPVKFNSTASQAAAGDSIRERIWTFGDGSSLGGNIVDPTHVYTTTGTVNVCLVIRTVGGCSDTACMNIQVPLQGQAYCNPNFTFTPSATNNVQFNSTSSTTLPGDSIITRVWSFGDGTSLAGNVISPQHQYAQTGVYNVCLRTITARGCEKTICKQVISTTASSNCLARYDYARVSLKKASFNSLMSWAPAGDSIVERKWNFGDGSPVLTGNITSPVHEFPNLGIYTTCLTIKTATGCTNTFCSLVRVQDSVNNPTNEPIKILQTYPNPATVQLSTVVWSLHNNVSAELSIYDIYGVKKWSINKTLLQGNNYTVLPVAQLVSGPYFFRVTTMYGVKSKGFYKL